MSVFPDSKLFKAQVRPLIRQMTSGWPAEDAIDVTEKVIWAGTTQTVDQRTAHARLEKESYPKMLQSAQLLNLDSIQSTVYANSIAQIGVSFAHIHGNRNGCTRKSKM